MFLLVRTLYIPDNHTTVSSIVCLNKDIIDMYSMFALNMLLYEYMKEININILYMTLSTWALLCVHDTSIFHLLFTLITFANMMSYMTRNRHKHFVTFMYALLNSIWITFAFITNDIIILESAFILIFGIQYVYDNFMFLILTPTI